MNPKQKRLIFLLLVKDKTLTEKAYGNMKHCNLKNVDLMLGDSRKLCFRENCVDSIVSGNAYAFEYQ